MSSTSAFVVFATGSALLGFWAVARYPALGPQSFRAALLATAGAFVLQSPLPSIVASVTASAGAAAALVLIVLPALTLLFWTSGCLVRSVVALVAPYRR